jgi:hypothetical protein
MHPLSHTLWFRGRAMEQDIKKQILPKTVLFRISSDDRVQVRPAIHPHAHTLFHVGDMRTASLVLASGVVGSVLAMAMPSLAKHGCCFTGTIFAWQTHVFTWQTHVFVWRTHVFAWQTHVFAWQTHVFAWQTHVFAWQTHVLAWQTQVLVWQTQVA